MKRISTGRGGTGLAVVGDPQQVADTLQEFIDIGCAEFCLPGYPHDEEATRFGDWVLPLLYKRDRLTLTSDEAETSLAVAD